MAKKSKIQLLSQQDVQKGMPTNTIRLGYDLIIAHSPIQALMLGIPFAFQYTTCTIVEEGRADISVDLQEFHLTKGTMIVVLDGQVVTPHAFSPDFKARFLFMSEDFLRSLQIGESLELRQLVRISPEFSLSDEILKSILQYFDMLESALSMVDNPNREKLVYHLTKAYFYGLGYYLNPKSAPVAQNRSQQIAQDFIEQVRMHFKMERSIRYYADLLHITPKYLSACVKEVTGYTAISSIEQQLVLYAQSLLANTQLTISQISDELHFDSQSTFGKYFCTHVGVGPKEWRKRLQLNK